MEENLLALESDIKLKIEHAFDVKHIYDIFAMLIAGMKHQQEQVRDLNSIVKVSNAKLKDMENSIENLEYNIQGFSSDDEFTDDDNPSIRRTGSSRSWSRRSWRKDSVQQRLRSDAVPPIATPEQMEVVVNDTQRNGTLEGVGPSAPISEAVITVVKEDLVVDAKLRDEGALVVLATVTAEEAAKVNSPALTDEVIEVPPAGVEVAAENPPTQRISRPPELEREWQAKKKRVLRQMYSSMGTVGRLRRVALSVTKSRLDPKLSVNNRIKKVEVGLASLKELVESHRQALDAVPASIKKVVPADLTSQLTRISAMVDSLENIQGALKPATEERTNDTNDTEVYVSKDIAVLALDSSGALPADILALISEQVSDRLRKEIPEAATSPVVISAEDFLSDDAVKLLSSRMLQGGHLDELRQKPGSSCRMFSGLKSHVEEMEKLSLMEQQEAVEELAALKHHTTGVGKDLTTHLLSRDDLSSMLDIDTTIVCNPSNKPGSLLMGDCKSVHSTAPDVNPRSPKSNHVTRPTAPSTGGEFATKLKTVMEQQIQLLTMNSVKKEELDDRIHSLEILVNLEFSKTVKENKEALTMVANPLKDRMANVERQLMDMNILLNSLEVKARAQTTYSSRLDCAAKDDSWRPELEKMNTALQESLQDQRTVATALLKDLGRLQTEIANRIDEKRLEELVIALDEKIHAGVERGVDPMMNCIANIVRAVKCKADRVEVQQVIAARIAETKENLKRIEDDAEAAGMVRCISCGNSKKISSPCHGSPDHGEAFHSSISSWRADAAGDYEQAMAVMHRKAGLKSLTRQTKPMKPANRPNTSSVPSPYHKTPKFTPEPVYRRANVAAQVKEMPKAPLITFGPAHANPSRIYQLDSAVVVGGSPTDITGSGVKFPRLPVSVPIVSQSASATRLSYSVMN